MPTTALRRPSPARRFGRLVAFGVLHALPLILSIGLRRLGLRAAAARMAELQQRRKLAEVEAILARDEEVAPMLFAMMFPDQPLPGPIDEDFGVADSLVQELWEETSASFLDAGFAENAEIIVAIRERMGLVGWCKFVTALRNHDMDALEAFGELITEKEKWTSPDAYNQLLIEQEPDGRPVIVIDQPTNPDYTPPRPTAPLAAPARGRPRSAPRRRESRGRAMRSRGSRRVTSKSAGGGGSGDPPDESDSTGLALGQLSYQRKAVAA